MYISTWRRTGPTEDPAFRGPGFWFVLFLNLCNLSYLCRTSKDLSSPLRFLPLYISISLNWWLLNYLFIFLRKQDNKNSSKLDVDESLFIAHKMLNVLNIFGFFLTYALTENNITLAPELMDVRAYNPYNS